MQDRGKEDIRKLFDKYVSYFFSIAFQDKKQTWSLFFSDQNEVTMRIIGLAMHQVLNIKRKIYNEKMISLAYCRRTRRKRSTSSK